MWEYSDKVKDHFHNPRNVGEIENPDGTAEVVSTACGDALKITFKVDEHEQIVEVKCKVAGCVSSIACASALTEMIKDITIEEAVQITDRDITDYLGGLPPGKTHASAMVQEALEKALKGYRRK
jgi:NifU-like protein